MKGIKPYLIAILAAGLLTSGAALADRGHGHGRIGLGFYFGAPYYSPYPYYPYSYYGPYPYYPPVVTAPASPPVYIERGEELSESPQEEGYYWYHCDKPEGYYPYVKQCPGGWQQVTPEPDRR